MLTTCYDCRRLFGSLWTPRSKDACFTDALERVVSMRLDTLLQRLRRGDDLYLWAVLYGDGAGALAQRCLQI